jgi:predicted DNA-binding transcriptional regulator AlpA
LDIMGNEYLTIEQVATSMGRTVKTVQRWIKHGRFPRATHCRANRLLWRRETVAAFDPVRPLAEICAVETPGGV